MSDLVSFHSMPLEAARSVDAVVPAPIDPSDENILRVGLSKEEVAASPKTEVRIVGDGDTVKMSREDGQHIRAVHQKTQADILKEGITEVIFERVGMKKTDQGFQPEWVTDAAIDRPLAASLALAIGRACAKKKT